VDFAIFFENFEKKTYIICPIICTSPQVENVVHRTSLSALRDFLYYDGSVKQPVHLPLKRLK